MIMYLTLIDSEEEQDKFVALFEKYKGMMFSSINKIINDKHLSEDILQEVFIKIAKNIDKVSDDIHSVEAKGFIMTITKNMAIDYYRKNAVRRDYEVVVEECEEILFYDIDEDLVLNIEPENRIVTILKSMKESYRDIFILKYVDGLENSEIADLLDVTEETIRQRISRGKKMIEEKIEGMGK